MMSYFIAKNSNAQDDQLLDPVQVPVVYPIPVTSTLNNNNNIQNEGNDEKLSARSITARTSDNSRHFAKNNKEEYDHHEQQLLDHHSYSLPVDPRQDDKAVRIQLCSFAQPHMRAFHCAWWGYHMAFWLWFAASPLLGEIRNSLNISNAQIWTSSIAGVGGTVFMRFILGPLCDKYGARVPLMIVLCAASIPTACIGLVHTATGLTLTRLCTGFAGGTFVMCQFWCTKTFTSNIVGTANATAAGWGNLGAGVAQLVMGSVLFPLFKWFFATTGSQGERIAEHAWRTVCIVPASLAFISGIGIYCISQDCPKGNYTQLKKDGHMQDVHVGRSFVQGAVNINTWLLFVQYACCFGVELTMNNAAALYFQDQFAQSTESAAAIASIFGWMNLFARGLGGVASDVANHKLGMRGRLWVQTLVLLAEGSLILVFANTQTLASAIVVMMLFSLFVQMAEGSTFGIVPFVDPPVTGSVSGMVGAGGNVGAVLFSLGFRQLPYKDAFTLMGTVIIGSAVLSVFVFIQHHEGLIGRGRSGNVVVLIDDANSVDTDRNLDTGSDEEDGITSIPDNDHPHHDNNNSLPQFDHFAAHTGRVIVPDCPLGLSPEAAWEDNNKPNTR